MTFLEERSSDCGKAIKAMQSSPFPLRKLSEEATDNFKDLAIDVKTYDIMLHRMQKGLKAVHRAGLWPSFYEQAARPMMETADNQNPTITKEDGIGQFIEHVLYENRDTTVDHRDIAVLESLLNGINRRFPSSTLQKFVP